jgi:hypothetical protein
VIAAGEAVVGHSLNSSTPSGARAIERISTALASLAVRWDFGEGRDRRGVLGYLPAVGHDSDCSELILDRLRNRILGLAAVRLRDLVDDVVDAHLLLPPGGATAARGSEAD